MSNEISNANLNQQPLTPGQETQSGKANLNLNQQQQETGKPLNNDTVTIRENAYQMAKLYEKIVSAEPTLNNEAIQRAKMMIKERSPALFGTEQQQASLLNNTASKMFELEQDIFKVPQNSGKSKR